MRRFRAIAYRDSRGRTGNRLPWRSFFRALVHIMRFGRLRAKKNVCSKSGYDVIITRRSGWQSAGWLNC